MGKGTLFYLISTVISTLCGYAIHVGLGRYLGPAQYGIFGIIVSLSTLSYVFFNYGIRVSVSKYIAQDIAYAYPILKAGMKIQLVSGIIFTFVCVAFADVIAMCLYDRNLAPFIRIMAIAILPSALYEAHLGFLNGTKAFVTHALVDIFYSISKITGVYLLVFLGFQVKGAISGYIIAAIFGLLIAKGFSKVQKREIRFDYKKLLVFAIPVIVFAIALSFLMNLDLLFVKAILRDNELTGFYMSASNIARTFWFVSGAFGGTLLPSISHSTSTNNTVLTKNYINQSLRYMMMLLVPVALIISGTSNNLVQFLYSRTFSQAGEVLSILVLGFLCLSVFVVLSTIISASGKPKLSALFILSVILSDIILNISLIPSYRLVGAAIATTVSCFVGLMLCTFYIYKKFKAFVNPVSLLKIGIASLVPYFIAINYAVSGFKLLIYYLILFSIYFLILLALREIKKGDFVRFTTLFLRIENQRA